MQHHMQMYPLIDQRYQEPNALAATALQAENDLQAKLEDSAARKGLLLDRTHQSRRSATTSERKQLLRQITQGE